MLSISLALSQTSSQRIIEETEQHKKNQLAKEYGSKFLTPKQQIFAQNSAFAVKDQPSPMERGGAGGGKVVAGDEGVHKARKKGTIYCEDLPEHVKAVLEGQISVGRVYSNFATKVEQLHAKVDISFNELQRLVSELKNEGAETLTFLDAARQNALNCFANFYGAATNNNNDDGQANGSDRAAAASSDNVAAADNSESTNVLTDAWLQESLYRCAVKECQIAWDECSQVLKKLFSQAHTLEQVCKYINIHTIYIV